MRNRGFTLIEVLIAIAILAILSTLAVGGYSSFMMRANRTDATRTMTLYAQSLERCYSQVFTYVGCAGVPAGPTATPQGYYSVTVTVATVPTASYTMTAVPIKAPQTHDSSCATFTLNNAGTQGASPGNATTCWGSS